MAEKLDLNELSSKLDINKTRIGNTNMKQNEDKFNKYRSVPKSVC